LNTSLLVVEAVAVAANAQKKVVEVAVLVEQLMLSFLVSVLTHTV
jgi:hypothetical protein